MEQRLVSVMVLVIVVVAMVFLLNSMYVIRKEEIIKIADK
jgi:hypothetical protein